MDNYLSEIRLFPFENVVPRGWMACNGQTLPINQNQALFSLIGTTYGGNGTTNFKLPNLNGRVLVGKGQSPLSGANYEMGQVGGTETVTLTIANMPAHTHVVNTGNTYELFPPLTNFIGNPNVPTSDTQTKKNANTVNFYNDGTTGTMVQLPADTVTSAGGSAPHENRMPFLVMTYCIATQGIYPSRG